MAELAAPSADTLPRRRWFQFRLRSLLGLMLVASVPLAWLGYHADQYRRQQHIIAQLSNELEVETMAHRGLWESLVSGNRIELGLFTPGGPLSTQPRGIQLETRHIRLLTAMNSLKVLSVWRPNGTDEIAPAIGQLTSLEVLEFSGSDLSDDGLKHLHKLKNLRRLLIVKTQVTNEGVAKFKQALPHVDVRTEVMQCSIEP